MAEKQRSYNSQSRRKRFGRYLRIVRKSFGMSEQDLADGCGYKSGTMITGIENASRQIDDDKVKEIANALDVSIGQLMGYRKIELSEKGWAKLSESERTALFLFAPIIEVLDEEDTETLLHTALMFCKAKGETPAWEKKPDFSIKKQDAKSE